MRGRNKSDGGRVFESPTTIAVPELRLIKYGPTWPSDPSGYELGNATPVNNSRSKRSNPRRAMKNSKARVSPAITCTFYIWSRRTQERLTNLSSSQQHEPHPTRWQLYRDAICMALLCWKSVGRCCVYTAAFTDDADFDSAAATDFVSDDVV